MAQAVEPVEPKLDSGFSPLLPYQVTFLTLGEEMEPAADYQVFTAWFPTIAAANEYALRKCMEPEHEYRLCYMISGVRGLFIPVPTMVQTDRMPHKPAAQKASENSSMLSSLMQRQLAI